MKKRYLLLGTALICSCMLTLSACSKRSVDNTKNVSAQEDIKEKEQTKENAEENIQKIIEPGYEDLEKFLDEEAANNRFQGVALVAEGDNIKFAKAYGYADADDKRENKLTTRFSIASNTKQFTATAVMQLVEQNKINLDDTIDKYFPKYKYGNKITVKNLLQMRSGIPDYLNEIDVFMKDEETLKILKDYENSSYFDKYVEDKRWSKDLILKNLYLTELYFEPGEAYDYSNTNYYLLGLIIEEASGLSYEDYINKYIFKPAKMTTSSMEMENLDAKGHGSDVSGEIAANPKFTYAAGDIHANIFDMFRWSRMLHKGNIVSEKYYKEMTTPVDCYGYGLFIHDNIIRHSGCIDGFSSNTEYNVSNDTTIIVLENNGKTTGPLDAQYHTSLINEVIAK